MAMEPGTRKTAHPTSFKTSNGQTHWYTLACTKQQRKDLCNTFISAPVSTRSSSPPLPFHRVATAPGLPAMLCAFLRLPLSGTAKTMEWRPPAAMSTTRHRSGPPAVGFISHPCMKSCACKVSGAVECSSNAHPCTRHHHMRPSMTIRQVNFHFPTVSSALPFFAFLTFFPDLDTQRAGTPHPTPAAQHHAPTTTRRTWQLHLLWLVRLPNAARPKPTKTPPPPHKEAAVSGQHHGVRAPTRRMDHVVAVQAGDMGRSELAGAALVTQAQPAVLAPAPHIHRCGVKRALFPPSPPWLFVFLRLKSETCVKF